MQDYLPNYPETAVPFNEVVRVAKGRFARCTITLNTDGTFAGDFIATNMVALTGCHIGGTLEFYGINEDLIARVDMPLLGLNPAGVAEKFERRAPISGTLKTEYLETLGALRFKGFENARPNFGPELLQALKDIKNVSPG